MVRKFLQGFTWLLVVALTACSMGGSSSSGSASATSQVANSEEVRSPPTDVSQGPRPTNDGPPPPAGLLALVPNYITGPEFSSPDAGLGDGFITVGPDCVTWTAHGSPESTHLLWLEGTATLEDGDTIRFAPVGSDEVFHLSSGDEGTVGGVPATGTSDFVVAPAGACPIDAFLVLAVRPGA
jgi:hypothetical protein